MRRLIAILPFREQWPSLLLGLALLMLTLIAGLALLLLSGWFISASALAGLGMIAMINIFTPGAAIRMAAVTRTVARYAERLASHAATLNLLTTLRMQVFSRLIRQPALFQERLQRGDALNRLTADIDVLDQVYLAVFQPAAAAMLLTLLTIALVAPVSPALAFGILLPLLLANVLTVLICHLAGRGPSAEQARAYPVLRQAVVDGLEARLELRALGQIDAAVADIERQSSRLLARGRRLAVMDALGGAFILCLNLLAMVLCLWVGLGELDGERALGPLLAALILGLFAVSEAWLGLPAAWRRLNQGLIAAERVQALCPAGQHDQPPSSSGATWPDRCDLSIRSLRFAWAPHQPELFGDLSFDLGEGQRLAVTGTSGCGKTSLLRLILGQIKPQDGRITVGGIDITSMDRATRYRNIAYLPQNPVLFRDSVAGNLRLVRDTASEEDLVKALNQAGLGNWLEALPNGLHTWLDEGADNLSGGERRRLAVAQLFLTDARLVLLDEPSASLDDRTLDDLNKSLDRWLVGRTTIVVTHREDALIPVDRTLRLSARAE